MQLPALRFLSHARMEWVRALERKRQILHMQERYRSEVGLVVDELTDALKHLVEIFALDCCLVGSPALEVQEGM